MKNEQEHGEGEGVEECKCRRRPGSGLTGRRGMTGRMRQCAAAQCCGGGGRETFFQNALLPVCPNIRPARSQHTHALRLNVFVGRL
jgi:hypothetical protein